MVIIFLRGLLLFLMSGKLASGFRCPIILSYSSFLVRIRQMTHDPERHQDPFTFNPERFLGENGNSVEPDPSTLAFGFGRR